MIRSQQADTSKAVMHGDMLSEFHGTYYGTTDCTHTPFVAGEYLVKDLTKRVGNLRNHRLEDGTLSMWQNFHVFGKKII